MFATAFIPGRSSVALCFDDAWASLCTVAAPLASPPRISGDRLRESLRACPMPARWRRPAGMNEPFATWDELRALQASGTVDIQAHSLRHAMVFCDHECMGL